jgi:hypothetical protein
MGFGNRVEPQQAVETRLLALSLRPESTTYSRQFCRHLPGSGKNELDSRDKKQGTKKGRLMRPFYCAI